MNPFVPEHAQRRLVLASKSPRRFDILTGLGFEFEVHPADGGVEEGVTCEDPFALPSLLARRKCAAVAEEKPDDIVIAADTLVILEGEILNKPRDDAEAARFLRSLSGKTHTVVTGVALEQRCATVEMVDAERTRVTFRELNDHEIKRYVETGEGRDKAGSYAAQGLGSGLIRSIDGCFYNVVGLPVTLLIDMLKKV